MCACVWDQTAGAESPLTPFWQGVHELEPGSGRQTESWRGPSRGELTNCSPREAGLREVEDTVLTVRLEHATFEDWWEPFTLGVGPAGVYFAGLDDERRDELREGCRALLPTAPFTLSIRAWTAKARP